MVSNPTAFCTTTYLTRADDDVKQTSERRNHILPSVYFDLQSRGTWQTFDNVALAINKGFSVWHRWIVRLQLITY